MNTFSARPVSLLFQELNRDEIGKWAPDATVILPVAAIEQHGPHLPVWTDSLLAESITLQAAARASEEIPILVCPVVTYGSSHHHLIYPGAMSLSNDTLIGVLRDLTDSLVSSGFRRIYLINAHGGNEECVRLAARELALRHPVIAGAVSYWTIAWDQIVQEGQAGSLGIVPGHAGGFETSLLLALRPDLVRTELLPLPSLRTIPPTPRDPSTGPLIQRHGSWAEIDGYSDNAGSANTESGRKLLEIISRTLAAEFVRFHQLKLN